MPDASGVNLTCAGTSPAYSNTTSGVTLAAQTGGTVTGPVVLGDNSTVINSGTLTAPAGTNVASFGRGGSFTLTSSASAAVTGNVAYDTSIVFGTPIGPSVASFVNQNTAFGFSGNVASIGNTAIDNAGLFTGAVTQTQSGSSVSILNEAAGVFTGTINTGDPTSLTNNGTMTLTGVSGLQSAISGGAPASTFTNNGTLNVGTATIPGQLNINGNFVQGARGTLGLTLKAATGTAVAGTNFSQILATGTAKLGGTLALNVTPGYYPSGSTYNVVVGNGGVSGGFSAITGNGLTFISVVPVGVVTAADLAPTSTAATLAGQTDVLTVAQAQAFFDSVSPAGYIRYTNAMRDQAQTFRRQVALRMTDQNSDHAEDGLWFQAGGNVFGKAARGTPNSRETGYQIDFGYDVSGSKYVLGAAFSYSQDHLTYGLGNLVGHNNAYIFGGYGAYHLGPLVGSGQVSYQLGTFLANKVITAGASQQAFDRPAAYGQRYTGRRTQGCGFDTDPVHGNCHADRLDLGLYRGQRRRRRSLGRSHPRQPHRLAGRRHDHHRERRPASILVRRLPQPDRQRA